MSKHDKIAKLKEYIKNFVIKELEKDEELEEVSTTATAGIDGTGTGHYDTPHAFSSGSAVGHKSPEVGGYKKVNESQPFADFPQFPKLSRAQQESLDELFGFAESYQIFNSFNNNPKKFIQTLDDMAKIRKASNKQPKGVNFNKGKKQFVKEALTAKGVNQFKKSIKLIGQFANQLDREIKKPKGKRNDQEIINLINAGSATFNVLSKLLKDKSINEGRYHDWRNDESMTPKQKIGISVREVRDALNELDKRIKMNLRLKTELSVDSRSYWKNTHKALNKISERLVKLATKVGSMK